jgi:hypothetical protein
MHSTKLTATLAILCLLGAPAAMADCGSGATGTKPVMVSVDDSGEPRVSPDTLRACEGDEVRWVFQGGAKEFSITFTGTEGTPCEWSTLTGATVICTVRSGALKDNQPTSYKYDVGVDGRVLDPTIIIEP